MADSRILIQGDRVTVETGEQRTVFCNGNAMATAAVIGCLHDEIERLRDFVVSQPCECYTEYGKRKPEPCERCRLTHGHETWIEFEQAADAAGGGDDN